MNQENPTPDEATQEKVPPAMQSVLSLPDLDIKQKLALAASISAGDGPED